MKRPGSFDHCRCKLLKLSNAVRAPRVSASVADWQLVQTPSSRTFLLSTLQRAEPACFVVTPRHVSPHNAH
jgi:hypothetical protein